jgi:hypothetical protein
MVIDSSVLSSSLLGLNQFIDVYFLLYAGTKKLNITIIKVLHFLGK